MYLISDAVAVNLCSCYISEVHCGRGFYIRSLVRDLGIGKKKFSLSSAEIVFCLSHGI